MVVTVISLEPPATLTFPFPTAGLRLYLHTQPASLGRDTIHGKILSPREGWSEARLPLRLARAAPTQYDRLRGPSQEALGGAAVLGATSSRSKIRERAGRAPGAPRFNPRLTSPQL